MMSYLQVFWCYHDVKLDGPVIGKHLVRPSPHRADELHSTNPIVCHENLLNAPFSTIAMNKLSGCGHLGGRVRGREGGVRGERRGGRDGRVGKEGGRVRGREEGEVRGEEGGRERGESREGRREKGRRVCGR